MMLLPDLYQLCGQCYGSHQNVYAIAFPSEKQMILFDTGLGTADFKIIQDNIKLWALDSYQIAYVFLTHSHFDHTGNAFFFEERKAQILIGEKDADAVERGTIGTIPYCYNIPFSVCHISHRISDGEKICINGTVLECYHTPGHTKGSMVYRFMWRGKTILVTGDFIQTGSDIYTPTLGISVDEGYCYEEYRKSLKKMIDFSCDIILPGHYQTCMIDGKRLLGASYREILVNRRLYQD